MSETNDPRGNEVAFSVKIDGTGLDAKAKSRAVAALDRLFGKALDVPGAWLEGIAQRRRLANDFQNKADELEAAAGLERLRELPELGKRALDGFVADQVRKQKIAT